MAESSQQGKQGCEYGRDSEGDVSRYTAEIQIKLIERGDCFYDVTKIKDITDGTAGQALIKAAGSVYDVFDSSIPQKSDSVNRKLSTDALVTASGRQKNTAEGGVKWATNTDFQTDFENNVDAVLNGSYNSDNIIIIGRTPETLTDIGLNQLPLTITANHIYSIAKSEAEAKAEGRYNKNTNYHGLGAKAVKQIGQKLSDPIMILAHQEFTEAQRKEHAQSKKITVAVELQINGKQVICPIEVDAEVLKDSNLYDANLISTYFDKRNFMELVKEAIAKENIGDVGFYYLNDKKANNLLQGSGYQLPQHLASRLSASRTIIRHISANVNRKISHFTESQQFKRWFGDWQNHPDKASKVVNADGTPKVMYHGIAMQNIDRIIENAVLFDTEVSEYGRGKKSVYTAFMHKFYAPIKIDGGIYIAKMAVEESHAPGRSDTNKKFYHVRAIEIETASSVGIGESHTPIIEETASTISIADLFQLVKGADKEFSPVEANSMFLNADGTPKVMYHGTLPRFR